jgi:hypothetical protein
MQSIRWTAEHIRHCLRMMVRMKSKWRRYAGLVAPGVIAFLLAGLSIADMFLPRPYDGVILESDTPGSPVVRLVVPNSGASEAGIRPGDVIVGIDRTVLEGTTHAQEILNQHEIGDRVPYLIRSGTPVTFTPSFWVLPSSPSVCLSWSGSRDFRCRGCSLTCVHCSCCSWCAAFGRHPIHGLTHWS